MLEVSLALGFRLRLLGPIASKVKQGAKRSSVLAQRSDGVESHGPGRSGGDRHTRARGEDNEEDGSEWTSLHKQLSTRRRNPFGDSTVQSDFWRDWSWWQDYNVLDDLKVHLRISLRSQSVLVLVMRTP